MPKIIEYGLPLLTFRGSPGLGIKTAGTDGPTLTALAIKISLTAADAPAMPAGILCGNAGGVEALEGCVRYCGLPDPTIRHVESTQARENDRLRHEGKWTFSMTRGVGGRLE